MNKLPLLRRLAGPCRATLSVLGIILSALPAFAQSSEGSLAGKVVHVSDSAPLAGAIVKIAGENITTATDRTGAFVFTNLPPGPHTVSVSYLGLESKDVAVTIAAGQRANVDVILEDGVIVLGAFVVEGQREGQARALNLQRSSANLVNVVSSDAAGKFPDQNAAETLQRIPGLSAERDQGEGRFVSIRGIDPDLNNTRLNGVMIPASEADTRKVNLDVIPSDLLESIEVTKAVTPDMDADAIGGSVDLKTQTAFSQDGRVLRGTLEGQYSDLSGRWGRRVSFAYGQQFNDGKVGLMLSLSDQKRHFGSDNRETGDPWEEVDGFLAPGGDIDHREYTIRRARQGISLSLDFRPTTDDEFYIRPVYNHYSDYEYRYGTTFGGDPDDTTPTSDRTGSVSEGGVAIHLKDREEDSNIGAVSVGGKSLRGRLTVDYQASFAHAELRDPDRFEPTFEGPDSDYTYDFTNELRPQIGGAVLNVDPADFELDELTIEHSKNTEREFAFAINAQLDTHFGSNHGFWKFGAKYRAKEKDVDTNLDVYSDDSNGALTLSDVVRTSGRGVTPAFPSIDGPLMREYFRSNPGQFEFETDDTTIESTLEDYVTKEDILAAYGMASVTIDKLTLLGGVRVERTSFDTTGFEITDEDPDTITAIAASRTYTDVLPGAHARYNFSDRLVARASWTQTIARPKFSDSAFRREIDEDGNYIEGNPGLDPYRSSNLDASIEFYPESLGVFSAGVFHKRIKDFIFRQTLGGAAPTGEDLITPLNGRAADISGVELAWQQQFVKLPAPFDGLGVVANLTLTDSEADLGDARVDNKMPFLFQSDTIANFALSYEKNRFFLRLAATHRSSYLNEIGDDPEEDLYVDDRLQLDLSTNYKISDRCTIYAEVLNLTDEPFVVRWGVTDRMAQAEYYMWSANVGVKLNF